MTPLSDEERQNLVTLLANQIFRQENFVGEEFAIRLARSLVELGWRRPTRQWKEPQT